MNDLPQNELFSAYLDGELSADEQAEMEQLLATSPAARQLLDELRALSVTLQSLPQESLGENLGPQVLHVVERRMLTGQEYAAVEGTPMPLVRSAFRRFLNRRALAWAGLALAIGAIISLNEWRQGSKPIARMACPSPSADNNRIVLKTEQDQFQISQNEAESPADENSENATKADMPAEPATPLSFGAAATALAPAEMSTDRKRRVGVAFKRTEAAAPKTTATPYAQFAPKSSALADGESPRNAMRRGSESAGKKAKDTKITFDVTDVEQTKITSHAAEGVMVIRCDISPKAAQRRALERLLDANGMTWREQPGRDRIEDKAREKDGKKKGGAEATSRPTVSEEINLVWVVATPAQVDAALAGLAAQPDVFLTHSVNPPSRELPEDIVQRFLASGRTLRQLVSGGGLFQFEQQTHVAGSATEHGTVGQLDMNVRGPAQQPSKADRASSVAKSAEEKQAAGGPMSVGPLAESASMQRVLFVLRVIDIDKNASASTVESKAETETTSPVEGPAKEMKPSKKER